MNSSSIIGAIFSDDKDYDVVKFNTIQQFRRVQL